MRSKENNKLINFWFTPKLPDVHYSDNVGFMKKWFFNPLKRWLAHWYFIFLKKFSGIKVIGITGSAGKTTTKEMIASILKLNGKTIYSKENIDPVYNIPNTILRCPPFAKYLILEMGVEYPGEMDFYLWLVRPDIGVITNIFPTHLEFLKSIKGVFDEKIKLVVSLGDRGVAILNKNDKYLKEVDGKIKARIVWFGANDDPIDQNSQAAVKVAEALGINDELIKKGLSEYQKPNHRLQIINLKNGAQVLDDSYNSNPLAMASTLRYFNKIASKPKKIAVLGDMLELGEYEKKAHQNLGDEVAKYNFDVIIGVGKASKYTIERVRLHSKRTKTYLVDSYQKVFPLLEPLLDSNTSILIKGSRSIGLDKVVAALS